MSVSEIDHELGMEVYTTKTPGIGGVIRKKIEDFIVEEVLIDGSKATIQQNNVSTKPVLGATTSKQHFLLCILVKQNYDTFLAIKNVSKSLDIKQSRIQFAGIKDAKAITAQHVTIEGLSFEEAQKVSSKDLELRPLGYFREQLSAFYLLGNNFTINITNLDLNQTKIHEQILQTLNEVQTNTGMPNFFGHQRFGTIRPITHVVGKALVQGNIKEAAMLFLAKPSLNEHPKSRQARETLQESQNFKQALEDFPSQLRYERAMISHLVNQPEDYPGAFRCLPLKLRMLFVQAYQSFLFNRFLSQRLKQGYFLNKAEIGDYVINVERSGLPMVRTGKIVVEDKLDEINKSIIEGKMRVALPIVGCSQHISKGKIGEIQQSIIDSEDINIHNFRVNSMPEINSKGELRAIVTPINNFNLKIGNEPEHLSQTASLEFMLYRGSYATVFLREIIKPQNPIIAGF
ncbi:MAG: tRNA pseudouridine(13) synthase TruD [Crenarchaeota archaeon]|nr:tRNA pseudouridine(13) synthase TruD [Thermoproteota archaeon]